ncbi:hypothetical protein KIN20_018035 [Parelaphostrongylus tenuis]|uniref:Uncharacterized protein n=1 Tax=Parelaphostrongylus tenuis TaxID=148309 RepID=A0AAD5N712_PARTN|nr:hypothetical protein KIN20_018035 [Parelaphostrongylus tenuis]
MDQLVLPAENLFFEKDTRTLKSSGALQLFGKTFSHVPLIDGLIESLKNNSKTVTDDDILFGRQVGSMR